MLQVFTGFELITNMLKSAGQSSLVVFAGQSWISRRNSACF